MARPLCLALIAVAIVAGAAAFMVGLADASHVAPFVGTWQNDDPATREQTRAVIGVNGSNLQVWGYGACVPTDCDWAAVVGGPRMTPQSDASDGQLSIVWEFGFKTQTQTLSLLPDGRLHITSVHDFHDGRPDRTSNEDFHKTTAPAIFHSLELRVSGAGKVASSPAGLDCPTSCSRSFRAEAPSCLPRLQPRALGSRPGQAPAQATDRRARWRSVPTQSRRQSFGPFRAASCPRSRGRRLPERNVPSPQRTAGSEQ
jgi:hypothetical protein